MTTETKSAVEQLIDKAAKADKSEDAMRFSQAATNCANALCANALCANALCAAQTEKNLKK
jgi:hypothetical protein